MPLTDEAEYFDTRSEQLARKLQDEHGLSRRQLLKLGAAGSLALATGGGLLRGQGVRRSGVAGLRGAAGDRQEAAGRMVRAAGDQRRNEMAGDGYLTPVEKFFVRNHTMTEAIEPLRNRLNVFGSGLKDPNRRAFTLKELRNMPSETRIALMECAGNGRSFFGSSRARQPRDRPGSSERSASRAGTASRCARCSNARASREAPSTSCPRSSTRK